MFNKELLHVISMSSRVAARSFGMGLVSAVAYEAVDTAAQYSDTSAKQVLTFMTNGQLILITSGLLLSLLGWYGLRKGMLTMSAFGFELGPLLLVVGISNIIKSKLAASRFGQIASVRPRIPASAARYVNVPNIPPSQAPTLPASPNAVASQQYF